MEIQKKTGEQLHPVTQTGLLKFLVPSLFGLFIFLFPVVYEGSLNIPLGVISSFLDNLLKAQLPYLATIFMSISAIMSTYTYFAKPKFVLESEQLKGLFNVNPFWLIIRLLGAVFALMVLSGTGFDLVTDPYTGGIMLFDLLSMLVVWFFAASFLMPFLLNFGIMDFVGTLIRNFVRPLFTLPGRSAIDLLTSWVGNCNVGVVITTQQHQNGYYTGREAATIATCFSAVSLPFCLVIAGIIDMAHMFPIFYAAVCIAGVVSAVIVPRIPPLSWKKDEYYIPPQIKEEEPAGVSKFQWALSNAVEKAEGAGGIADQLRQGGQIFAGIVFVLMAQAMALGTISLIVVEYTPFFDYLAAPMVYLLEILRIPEAVAAAPATLVGFADMFIPAIILSGVESELTRFVIGALSLVQIIYMTEVGILILISKIPVNFRDLILIFIERTLISLPVIAIIGHLVF